MSYQIRNLKCKQCGKDFTASTTRAEYCSKECKGISKAWYISSNLEQSGTENIDYVKCKWCGMSVERIYGGHITRFHKGKSAIDYRKEFGDDVLIAIPADKEATSKSSGLHMKQAKYRKIASDAFKGDKNPMSKVNASEQKRKENSPFSIEFYRKRFPGLSDSEYKQLVKDKVYIFLKDRLTWNQKEYWTKKGYSLEEATIKIGTLQNRGLVFLQDKYGINEGFTRWHDRNTKWKAKVFNNEQYIGQGYSKVSTDFFNILYNNLLFDDEQIMFGKSEKFIRTDSGAYKYDFPVKDKKKIIEFNGDYWHCNPSKFDKRYWHTIKKKSAEEIWSYDHFKIKTAESYGYTVLTVWEDDYYKDPDKVIKDCLEFLNS